MDKPDLNDNIDILWLLLLSTNIFNLSLIPHYSLYVKNKDIELMAITVFSAIMNIILNYILIPKFGSIGASFSLLMSYSLILILSFFGRQL